MQINILITIVYVLLVIVLLFTNMIEIPQQYDIVKIPLTITLGFIVVLINLFHKELNTNKKIPQILLYFFILSSAFVLSIYVLMLIINFFMEKKVDNNIFSSIGSFIFISLSIYLGYKFLKHPKIIEKIKGLVLLLGNEYNNTNKFVIYLLLAETILLLNYFLFPKIKKLVKERDSIQLLKHPVYLNKERKLNIYDKLHNKKNEDKIFYNFSLKADIYINPQPENTKGAFNKNVHIINFGNQPVVEYNVSTNNLIIKSHNNPLNENIILNKIQFPLQKWNTLTVQYNDGIVDIFLNGKLIRSKKNMIPYKKFHDIVIGQKNGIEGSIKNIFYYNRNIDLNEI